MLASRSYLPTTDAGPLPALRVRAQLYGIIREYLDARGYLEVDTPVLYPRPEIAPAPQFCAGDPLSGTQLFLRVCPTEHLKRLLIAGIPAAYEISRNFRPETCSPRHLSEFTSLECTLRGATCEDMLALTEELVSTAVARVTGGVSLPWEGRMVDFSPPWRRLTVRDALLTYVSIDLDRCQDVEALRIAAAHAGAVSGERTEDDFSTMLEWLIDEHVLPNLSGVTVLTEYPHMLGGPAAPLESNPAYRNRCEVFVGSLELANMSSHLNDAGQLLAWHQMSLQRKEALGLGDTELDEYLMRDIAYGLPTGAVVGIGLDRLLMVMAGVDSIDHVVAFPLSVIRNTPMTACAL